MLYAYASDFITAKTFIDFRYLSLLTDNFNYLLFPARRKWYVTPLSEILSVVPSLRQVLRFRPVPSTRAVFRSGWLERADGGRLITNYFC